MSFDKLIQQLFILSNEYKCNCVISIYGDYTIMRISKGEYSFRRLVYSGNDAAEKLYKYFMNSKFDIIERLEKEKDEESKIERERND